jgi:hypothetical protein
MEGVLLANMSAKIVTSLAATYVFARVVVCPLAEEVLCEMRGRPRVGGDRWTASGIKCKTSGTGVLLGLSCAQAVALAVADGSAAFFHSSIAGATSAGTPATLALFFIVVVALLLCDTLAPRESEPPSRPADPTSELDTVGPNATAERMSAAAEQVVVRSGDVTLRRGGNNDATRRVDCAFARALAEPYRLYRTAESHQFHLIDVKFCLVNRKL